MEIMPHMIKTRLAELLEEKGITMYSITRDYKIPLQTLLNVRDGNTAGISYKVLDKLCKALECTPGDLLIQLPGEQSKGNAAKKKNGKGQRKK